MQFSIISIFLLRWSYYKSSTIFRLCLHTFLLLLLLFCHNLTKVFFNSLIRFFPHLVGEGIVGDRSNKSMFIFIVIFKSSKVFRIVFYLSKWWLFCKSVFLGLIYMRSYYNLIVIILLLILIFFSTIKFVYLKNRILEM